MRGQTIKIQDITMIGLMAALICILGPLSVTLPFTPIPISFTNLAIYFLIGAAGIPVFSGFGAGLAKIAGPTGGYLAGFIFLALISGFFVEKFPDNYLMIVLGMILGTAVTYAFGTLWLCGQMNLTFVQGLYAGVIPYLPGDAVKILIGVVAGQSVRKSVRRAVFL